jgi:hypothetical protein
VQVSNGRELKSLEQQNGKQLSPRQWLLMAESAGSDQKTIRSEVVNTDALYQILFTTLQVSVAGLNRREGVLKASAAA